MFKIRWVLFVVLAAAVAGGWWVYRNYPIATGSPSAAKQQPAVPVGTVLASRRDVPITLEGLGSVQAFNAVTIHTQVDGQLIRVLFKEGQEVHAGDVLVQIDPRSLQAGLDQAQAKKAQDSALLANAKRDMDRYAALVAMHDVTQQQFDTTRAQVTQYAAAVQGDDAAIENARVLLDYTTIRAPIDGRVGIRQIDQGNIVHVNDANGLVSITQVHPITVLFNLPQDNLPQVVRAMAAGPLKVLALSRDRTEKLDEGQLELVDNQIDPASGTIRLKATMPNLGNLLWPGQFVNARLMVGIRAQAVTVPATAILRGQQGAYAYVVKQDGTVEMRTIVTKQTADDLAVIDDGIQDGETVVTSGQFRLQPGSRVEAKPAAVAQQPATAKSE
jgi:multidrug efflux system membrane fusion protein